MNTKNKSKSKSKSESEKSKGIIGITLAAIMIASIFAIVAPTMVVAPTMAARAAAAPPPPVYENSSIRIYGDVQPHGNAPERYDDAGWWQPFDPTVIPKDSFTCNPGVISREFGVKVGAENAREKIFLRGWYEPCGIYWGDRKNYTYPTINLEYTYMFMSTQWEPTHGGVNSLIALPTCEIDSQVGLGAYECSPEKAVIKNLTRIAAVSGTVGRFNKTTDGLIELERAFSLSPGDEVQFLDHTLKLIGATTEGDYVIKVWYAGNADNDAGKGWIVLSQGSKLYFDRHINRYDTVSHTFPIRTWYVKLDGSNIILGKELRKCDVFYVNGVRYDVTAIEVLDTTGETEAAVADHLKYITIRTKLPKGHGVVPDESVVSSQWIKEFAPAELIPVLPPFNKNYSMVDDIDIPLHESASHERKLTQQPWTYSYTESVGHRVLNDVAPLDMIYIAETEEKRYSTDLLEKLNEVKGDRDPVYENWTKFDVQTLPDQYTEFVLPARPDIPEAVSLGLYGDYLITTSLIAPQAEGDLYDHKAGGDSTEQRVAFSYDPRDGEDGIDIYVNYNVGNNVNTVRIYGHGNSSTGGVRNDCWIEQYADWEEPFNPTVIRKDSITFDATILPYSPKYSMHAQGEDCDLKAYLRAWYVPKFKFYGEHCAGSTQGAVITETTYMLIESQDKKPWHANANYSWFPFPIVADLSDGKAKGLEFFENEGVESEMENLVLLSYVNCTRGDLDNDLNKTTNGTIRIEKTYIMHPGDEVQFIDHNLKFEGYDITGLHPIADIWYSGNKDCKQDAKVNNITISNETKYWSRHNIQFDTPEHPGITWYTQFVEPAMADGTARITVGKEFQRGDVFYVDGVRYEIPAIEVLDWDGNLDNGCEKFKYITIRSPFPKGVGEMLDECGDCDSATSQYIWKVPHCNAIPVLPPINMDRKIVDDTDVVLWKPLKLLHKWPYGDKDSNRPGVEYFPCAERYLTQQYPPYAWLKYFRAVPIDTDNDMDRYIPTDWELWENYDGPFYPGNVTEVMPDGWQCCKCGIPMPLPDDWTVFDNEHWIANDVDERIIDADPLEFCWKSEKAEPRYSTNLVEILNETISGTSPIVESWWKYDIRTLPDEYTEFKLPVIPSLNPVVYVGGEYQQTFEPDERQYPGSYLITTSFYAPNALGDLNLYQLYYERDRFAFTYNASDGTGIYMNENVTIPIPPVGDRFEIPLYEGPNYVSMPVMPAIKDPIAIFGPEVNVWSYNTGTGNWESVSAVAEGTGYYAYAPKPKTVTVYGTGVSLPTWSDIDALFPGWTSGWNLVGPGNTSVSVPPSGVQILRYSRVHHDFLPVPPSDKLEPGVGYWAYK